MRALVCALFAGALFAVPAVVAAESSREHATITVKKAGGESRLICKRTERTGSRLARAGQTRCLTQLEWEMVERETQEQMQKMMLNRKRDENG